MHPKHPKLLLQQCIDAITGLARITIETVKIALPVDIQFHKLSDSEAIPVKSVGSNYVLIQGLTTEALIDSITIIDSTKDFSQDLFTGKVISLLIDDKYYLRKIIDCIGDQLTIEPVQEGSFDSVTLQGGAEQGNITITYQNPGDSGYTIELVPNTSGLLNQQMGSMIVDQAITITSSTDENGNSEPFWAISIQEFFASDPDALGLPELFTVVVNSTGEINNNQGNPIEFTGGTELITIPLGTEYEILY